ncbi:MAG: MafI family immunity protein [Noviherbaspirillum sp.]
MSLSSTPSAIIFAVLNEFGKHFPDATVANACDLLNGNEPGLALEVLCTQLNEYAIELPPKVKADLEKAAHLMGIPLDKLDYLN